MTSPSESAQLELSSWLNNLRTLGEATGAHLVAYLPDDGGMPQVTFESPDGDGPFASLLQGVRPRVLYSAEVRTSDDLVTGITEMMEGADDLDMDGDLPNEIEQLQSERSELLDRASRHVGDVAGAAAIFVVDGVSHRLRLQAAWWSDLIHDAQDVAQRIDSINDNAEQLLREQRIAERHAEVAIMESMLPIALELETELRNDSEFLSSGSDNVRRRYVHALLLSRTGWEGELPPKVRGAANTASENAMAWWRSQGKPMRTATLREQFPELAKELHVGGTLSQRTRAALALLMERDPLAASRELADELARFASPGPDRLL